MRRVGNVLTRRKGVGVFGSALLRREGVRGFGFGIGCSGVIQMTRDGRRQVGIGRIGVGSVTVVTIPNTNPDGSPVRPWIFQFNPSDIPTQLAKRKASINRSSGPAAKHAKLEEES